MRLHRVRDFLSEREGGEGGPPRIGRYELIEEIGRGGSSVVWKARDLELDRLVALKLLRDGSLDRLRREAMAAARLRHPHIVTVHEVGPDYIVMDLVPGRTLAEALPELDRPARLRLLHAVALAVAHAHAHGVIHRDLKPANILIEDGGRPVLTDFGLAKLEGGADLTQEGTVMGTPAYMAPEQVRGKAQGAATDIWALGVILYECMADTRPFAGETPLSLYEAIIKSEPARLPGALGVVAAQALQKDPARRYGSANALAADLQRVLDKKPVAARRSRARAWLGLALLALLCAGIVWTWRSAARPPHAPAANEKDEPMRLATWQQREAELSRQIEIAPTDRAAILARGEVRLARADFALDHGRNALPDFNAGETDATLALALTGDPGPSHYLRGRIRVQRAGYKVRNAVDPESDVRGAEEDLIPLLDREVNARAWLANGRFQRGLYRQQAGLDGSVDFLAAERDLVGVTDAGSLMRRARTRAHLGKFDEADADFAACLVLEPDNRWAWMWRGVAAARAGKLDPALEHLSRAVVLAPNFAEAWAERGHVRRARGAFAAAESDYAEAIRLNPSLAPALASRRAGLGTRGSNAGPADR